MLAYLFWHRPRSGVAPEDYEQAQLAFHRSLARQRPVGMCGSALLRAEQLPWLEPAGAPGYEDWYLVEDFAALGVLNEAAVGRGHRSSHERAARHAGAGAGGLFGLLEGPGGSDLFAGVGVAVWVEPVPGTGEPALAGLLGDGAQPGRSSLWRRRMVLGPAPELCLLAPEQPAGTGPGRLPEGWLANAYERDVLYAG